MAYCPSSSNCCLHGDQWRPTTTSYPLCISIESGEG
jgi:hypothetical protein